MPTTRRGEAGRGRSCRGAVTLAVALLLGGLAALAGPAAVAGATTGTSVSISTPSSSTYWTTASVGVTVTAASGPNPTSGTVTITDSFGDFSSSCTMSLSGSNETSCLGTYSAVGTDTITASYEGSGSFAPSSGQVQVSVAQAAITISVEASEASVGETTTVTVAASPGLGANDSGTLTITDTDAAVSCSTSFSADEAQCSSTAFAHAGEDEITASWAGNSDYHPASASSSLDITQAPTVVASITAPASQVAASATITVQVQPTPDGGSVELSDADGEVSGCRALAVSPTSGQAVCTTAALTAADPDDALSAQYLGDADYATSPVASGSLEIDRGTSHVTLGADPSPSVGATATYVATVGPSAAGAAGGSVAFSDSDVPAMISDCGGVALEVSTGEASCTSLTYSAAGSDTVTASFGGNANWAPSSVEQAFDVSTGTPGVVVSFNPAQPAVGERVTVTATVSPSDGGGSVSFSGADLSGCTAVALSGSGLRYSAACTSEVLGATGQWSVQASYSGDANYKSSLGATTASITAAATTVVLASSPANPQAFAPATLTATVSPVPDGGTLSFSGPHGTLSGCGAVAVSATTGEASCPVAELPGAGSDELSATYSGDTDYETSNGQLDLLIAKIATTLLVTAAPNPLPAGQRATLTISVSPVPDGGAVSVGDSFGDVSCDNLAVPTSGAGAGTATCITSTLSPAGSDALTATYSGSADDTGAAATGSITVEHDVSTTVVASVDGYGVIGGQLHMTVQVSPPPSDGTVEFADSLGELTDCAAESVDPTSGDAACVSGALTTSGRDVVAATFLETPTEGASSVSVTIPIEEAPSFSAPLDATLTVGTPVDVQLPVSGFPAPQVSTSSTLPDGLSLTSSGTISGTAVAGSGGTYAVALVATNSLSSTTGTLELVVEQAPAISSSTSLSVAYGVQSSLRVESAPGSYPVPSFTLSGALPAGMSFVDNGDGSATISGAPGDGVSGIVSFAVVVANPVASVRVSFTIEVTGTPPASSGQVAPPPPPPPVSTTPAAASSSSTPLSPVAEALHVRRAEVVPSAGHEPAVTERGALPGVYDPIAPMRTIRRHGKPVAVPVVVLGEDRAFPTLGNVGPYGDCAVVADSSIVRLDHLEARRAHVPPMTTNEALSEWSAINGGSGEGLTDSELLHAWAGPAGLLGTRLAGWSDVDPQDLTAMKRALVASGALYATIVLPESLTLSTTIDPPISATTEVAGHSLAVFGWTATGFLVVTWGEVAVVPYAWWSQYAATAYALAIVGSHAPSTSPRPARASASQPLPA